MQVALVRKGKALARYFSHTRLDFGFAQTELCMRACLSVRVCVRCVHSCVRVLVTPAPSNDRSADPNRLLWRKLIPFLVGFCIFCHYLYYIQSSARYLLGFSPLFFCVCARVCFRTKLKGILMSVVSGCQPLCGGSQKAGRGHWRRWRQRRFWQALRCVCASVRVFVSFIHPRTNRARFKISYKQTVSSLFWILQSRLILLFIKAQQISNN